MGLSILIAAAAPAAAAPAAIKIDKPVASEYVEPVVISNMSAIKSGTEMYMSLYPEAATDGGLRLGNVVPDFTAETTKGPMESFHAWKAGKWAILFSHPADFTPVCTTEIGRLALKYDTLAAMDCLVATLSVDPVKSHDEWLTDVVAHCENNIEIKFPIIGDQTREISTKYGMIDPGTSGDQSLPLTIRAVFIINPENKLMLTLNYPACVGRSMDEIVRCVKALQLSYEKSIATPANWPYNHADIPIGDGRTTDFKGSVFLLPTVSEEEAKKHYPNYHTCGVPSEKNYLRLVKLEDLSGAPQVKETPAWADAHPAASKAASNPASDVKKNSD